MCNLLLENVRKKNPKGIHGITPLHLAASNGQLEVCELILKNIKETNPIDDSGMSGYDDAVVG